MSVKQHAQIDYYWPFANGQLWLPSGRPPEQCPEAATSCFRIDFPATSEDGARHWIALSDAPQWLAQEHWCNLRDLLEQLPRDDLYWASRALQIGHWWQLHQYCSRCATALPEPEPLRIAAGELVRVCPTCQIRYYPVQTPCIIVLVTDGDYCLLAQHQHSRTGSYTTLAGFVEAGERIEQTVLREVFEEVGLTVKGLEYIDSQSWPFPAQLMLGFYAQYDSGTIVPQLEEIREAHWYHYRDLPKVPPVGTIARQLIDGFVQRRHEAAGNNS